MTDPATESSFRDFEHAGWQRAAPAYERYWERLTAGTLPVLLDRAGVRPGLRILDVACGTGTGASLAAERGAAVSGVDFSVAMIERARRRVPNAHFLEADADALPFPDESFEAVICNFGLLHFARPEIALGEMARCLRPGGRLAAAVWAGPGRMRLLGIAREAVAAAATAPDRAPPGPDFFRYSDPDRFAGALTAAGLVRVAVELLPLSLPIPDAGAFMEMVAEGTVRTAALLRGQPPASLAAIREEIARALEFHRDTSGAGYTIPADALMAVGSRP
jgi:SAM-dependent methyltransferase